MLEFEFKNGFIKAKKNGIFKDNLKYIIGNIIFRIISCFFRIKEKNAMYDVSICAIFKNEAPYLKEWIEYHKVIGINHFFLYNNNSSDDYANVLERYLSDGTVTLLQWDKDHAQMECYYNCIKSFSHLTKWLGFIDLDEFVVPVKYDNIYSFLHKYERKVGAIKIYWKMFGTSGKIERDDSDLVTESFVACWPAYYDVGKCFYNTQFGFDFECKFNYNFHHDFWANYGGFNIPPVDTIGNVCWGNVPNKNNEHPVQINHYFTKSVKEYEKKKSKGDVFFVNNPHDEEFFILHERQCSTVDYSIIKYLSELKIRLLD